MNKYLIFTTIVLFTLACGNKENKSVSTYETGMETVTVDGAKIFKQSCELCHGRDGKLGANGSKDLTISEFDINERIALISKGKGVMTAFENILSPDEIKAVAEYSMTLNNGAQQ